MSGVSIYIDGTPEGAATTTSRPDVCAAYPGRPGCPNVGWYFQFDTRALSNGAHTFTSKAVSADGQTFAISQIFQVSNYSSYVPVKVSIDSPSTSGGAFSGNLQVSGWAVDDDSAVNSVDISVDGISYGAAFLRRLQARRLRRLPASRRLPECRL